ncbi:hypothetical protein F5B20DRAFT_593159 [Whalleya microplaca]|nr:hypothetical protein F5B20DRAFT_593159 [Whalleya microplaca]
MAEGVAPEGAAPGGIGAAADLPYLQELTELKNTKDKGLGLFAKRDINPGSLITLESPILQIEYDATGPNVRLEPEIAAFNALSEEDQQKYLQLYERIELRVISSVRNQLKQPRPDNSVFTQEQINLYTRVHCIFRANNFSIPREGGGKSDGVFPQASRFNHSCDPNVTYSLNWKPGYWGAVACRFIPKGEELTISYLPLSSSREERQVALYNLWGFICKCSMCEGRDEYVEALERCRRSQEGIPTEGQRNWVFEDVEDEALSERIDRRLQLVSEMGWRPEIFFEGTRAGYYHSDRYAALRETDKAEALKHLQLVGTHLHTACVAGYEEWGEKDELVQEARNHYLKIRAEIVQSEEAGDEDDDGDGDDGDGGDGAVEI